MWLNAIIFLVVNFLWKWDYGFVIKEAAANAAAANAAAANAAAANAAAAAADAPAAAPPLIPTDRRPFNHRR